MTNEEIIKEFKKGHKGEELMEVAEAEAEIQIALETQKKEVLNMIGKMIKDIVYDEFCAKKDEQYKKCCKQVIKDIKELLK